MKNPYLSKTIIGGAIVALLAAINAFMPFITDAKVLSALGSVVGILTIINRFFTEQKVAPLTDPTKGQP